MDRKTAIWGAMTIGSLIGGYIPSIWGADVFSLQGVLLSAIGGIFGIWIGYKMGS